jgi:hypothetical protein
MVPLLVFSAVGCTAYREAHIYRKSVPPASAVDVLRQYKLIADHHLYGRDDFYQDKALRALFGQVEEIKILRNSCPWSGRADIYRFARFFPPPSATVVPGFYISATKYDPSCEKLQPSLRNALGRLDMKVQGTTAGLDFKSVTDVFGPHWVEDQHAEWEKYNAIAREPWNPAPPRATGYMGNSIIKYVSPTSTIFLGFSSDGRLWYAWATALAAAPQSSGKPTS